MKTSRTAAVLLGAVALAGVGFAGCGSSDTPATTAAATADGADAGARLTAEEYRAAADKVCSDATAKVKALTPPSDPAEIKAYVSELGTIGATVAQDLTAVVPPVDLEPAAKKLIEANLQGVEFVNKVAAEIPDPATDADVTAVVEKLATSEAEAFVADEKAAAAELGLTECGKDASSSDSAE